MPHVRQTVTALIFPVLIAAPAAAADDRHQSYVSWEDGGAAIVQAFDARRIQAQRNVPVYPGDQIETARRGRVEVTLADGNVLALDRDSRAVIEQIAYSYEGPESSETVVSFSYGQMILHRPDATSAAAVRVDTAAASYAGSTDSIFSIDTTGRGRDTLSVFSGLVEVRTQEGRERVRPGEQVSVDHNGIYGSNVVVRGGTSEFERWYLDRAQRFGRSSSRHLPERFSRYERDLSGYGNWVWVGTHNTYAWRPSVGHGWRPYTDGYWAWSPSGSVWVSYEPWGWMPYHYGRWTMAPGVGWVWFPSARYSHAWVYWVYGPSYVGWVPAGWYDCYPAYYDWRYRPYHTVSRDVRFGFHGRVSLRNLNLDGWTFVDSRTFFSNRVDQASLSLDAVRSRLSRDGDRAVFSSVAARFDRSDREDPSRIVERVARQGLDRSSVTGRDGSGSLPDLTSFVRRDPELSPDLRAQVSRLGAGERAASARNVPAGVARPGAGASAPAAPSESVAGRVARPGTGERVTRTPATAPARPAVVQRPGSGSPAASGGDTRPAAPRSGLTRGERPATGTVNRPAAPPSSSSSSESWRRPSVDRGPTQRTAPRAVAPRAGVERQTVPSRPATRGDDTPRRVIDTIRGSEARRPGAPAPRASAPAPTRQAPAPRASAPERSSSTGRATIQRPAAAPQRDTSSSSSSSSTSSAKSESSSSTSRTPRANTIRRPN